MLSSLLMYAGVPGSGLRISEGYEADTGVWRVASLGLGLASFAGATAKVADVVLAMSVTMF